MFPSADDRSPVMPCRLWTGPRPPAEPPSDRPSLVGAAAVFVSRPNATAPRRLSRMFSACREIPSILLRVPLRRTHVFRQLHLEPVGAPLDEGLEQTPSGR